MYLSRIKTMMTFRRSIQRLIRNALIGIFFLSACFWSHFFFTNGSWEVPTDELILKQNTISRDTQAWRQLQISRTCEIYNDFLTQKLLEGKPKMSYILVDDHNKVLYCWIPKAGSTTWRKKIAKLQKRHYYRSPLPKLHTFNSTEQMYRLRTYFKYIIVRHPLVRLVSAFRDKILNVRNKYYDMRALQILRHVKPKWYKSYLRNATGTFYGNRIEKDIFNITFTDFLNYTFRSHNKLFRYEQHWNTMANLCTPCLVHYDYIAHLETFLTDTKYLLFNIYKSKDTDPGNNHNPTGSDLAIAIKYFQSVPETLRLKIMKEYEGDAKLFGYDLKDFG